MIQRNRLYVFIISIAAVLTFLNISAGRRSADHSLFDPLVDVCDLIQKYYVTETNDAELATGAINGMLHKLDPYSEYIPADKVDAFHKQTSGSYEGIGTAIDIQDGYLTVISPFDGSPAHKAGILPGDKILEVDGKSTKGWSATRAVQELTGPARTQITLRLVHADGTEETVTITRKEVHMPTVRGWRHESGEDGWDYMLDKEAGIGFIRISQFAADTAEELDLAVEKLRSQNVNALIIDLRSNPGGLMSTAIEIVDRFIDEGVIVSTRGAHTTPQVQEATSETTYPRFAMVVLIDQGSASASEIVAGALQDHNRAVIVGKRSWGKGSVQRPYKLLESGALLKLTTDYYYLPKGRCVHRRPDAESWGVTPDVEEKLDLEKLPELRELMVQLSVSSRRNGATEDDTELTDTSDKTQTVVPKDDSEKENLLEKLLDLDAPLAQALKQCKGLLRAQSTLKGLVETLVETESDD